MTTVAYKDGVIAYDGLIVAGGEKVDIEHDKRIRVGNINFFWAGALHQTDFLIESFLNQGYTAPEKIKDVQAIVWDGHELWQCGFYEDGFIRYRENPKFALAIGSGGQFAVGAMEAGASAKKAVEIAAKRDLCTGGRIRTVKIF